MSPAPTKTALLVVCAWAERLSYKDEDAERRHDGHEPILTMPNANHGTGTYLLSPLFNNMYFTVPRVSMEAARGRARSAAACWRVMRWVILILLPRRQPEALHDA